jgi:hypothetical protein
VAAKTKNKPNKHMIKVLDWISELLTNISRKIAAAEKWEKLYKIDDCKNDWTDVRDLLPWDVKNIINKRIESEVERKLEEEKEGVKI